MDTATLLDVEHDQTSRGPAKGAKGKRTKRKWREIEQLKEKRRLLEELREMDSSFDGELADLEI